MILLWVLSSLWMSPPDGVRPSEESRRDLDGDGVLDRRIAWMEGGSGYKTWTTCVHHGASGHTACRFEHTTAYAQFAGVERRASPALANRALPLLPSDGCAPADERAPEQAMLWTLDGLGIDGRVVAPRWHPGRPAPQASVCLSPSQAARLTGGGAWSPSGAPQAAAVVFRARWPQWSPPPGRRDARRILQGPDLEVYRHGHALAIYRPSADQHAWVFNAAAALPDGFKLDRWESLTEISLEADGLRVVLGGGAGLRTIPL